MPIRINLVRRHARGHMGRRIGIFLPEPIELVIALGAVPYSWLLVYGGGS